MSSVPLILTDGGLALSEPKAVGAQGSTKVLAASSLGSCLVFVSSAVVTVALEDRHGAGDTSGYRNDAMRIAARGVSICLLILLPTSDRPDVGARGL